MLKLARKCDCFYHNYTNELVIIITELCTLRESSEPITQLKIPITLLCSFMLLMFAVVVGLCIELDHSSDWVKMYISKIFVLEQALWYSVKLLFVRWGVRVLAATLWI